MITNEDRERSRVTHAELEANVLTFCRDLARVALADMERFQAAMAASEPRWAELAEAWKLASRRAGRVLPRPASGHPDHREERP